MVIDLPVGSYLLPESFYGLDRIERVSPLGAADEQWAVRCNGLCLSRALEWNREPVPSSSARTPAWCGQHRYASPEEAYRTWQCWRERVADDGR